jgi:hypothetical protein
MPNDGHLPYLAAFKKNEPPKTFPIAALVAIMAKK